MAFDPDAYLETYEKLSSGGFDPDAYLTTFDRPDASPSLASQVVSAIQPEVTATPQNEPFLSRLTRATRQTLFPTSIDEVRSLANPNFGQFGLSKILEEEGKRVGAAVRASDVTGKIAESPMGANIPVAAQFPMAMGATAVDVLSDSLSPSGQQQNLGAEGVGQAASIGAKAAAKGLAKGSELLTGTQASNFKRLVDDPAAILPESLGGSMSKKKAGAALGQAEREAGFVPTRLEPETGQAAKGLKAFEGKTSPFKGDQGIADEFYQRVAKGEQLTPQEALEAYKATSRNLSKMSRKDARYVEMLRFEKALGDELEVLSPAYAAAKKQFARSAMGEAASNILPRTATGKVSQGRVGFNALIFGGGSIINPAAAAGLLASSPVVHGVGHALAGAASKIAAIPGVGTAALTGFRALIQRAKERLNEKGKDIKPVGQEVKGRGDDFNGKSLSEFVRSAKVGTTFTYGGKRFKVVPQPGRSKESLAKATPEERRIYFASKSRNRGSNTFAPA